MSRRQTNTEAARDLRQRMTPAEAALWQVLRDRGLYGLKFRRHVPIGPFVVDFACLRPRLVVEVDGSIHDEQVEQDEYRTHWIETAGYRVLRFRNEEILDRFEEVLQSVQRAARDSTPPLPR